MKALSWYKLFLIGGLVLGHIALSQAESYFPSVAHPNVRSPQNFATVKAGSFMMGSPLSETGRDDDEILHNVTLTQNFEMQKTEVTQMQWYKVMGYNPSFFASEYQCPESHLTINDDSLCPNYPVESLSHSEMQEFIKKLNEADSEYLYSLPTEAQWEYAARAGTNTAYSFGDDVKLLGEYGWFRENAKKQTKNVGLKKPNSFGLYDMHGNVSELCRDFYQKYSGEDRIDPVGPATGKARNLRGGGYSEIASDLRSSFRFTLAYYEAYPEVGFRIMRVKK